MTIEQKRSTRERMIHPFVQVNKWLHNARLLPHHRKEAELIRGSNRRLRSQLSSHVPVVRSLSHSPPPANLYSLSR